MIYIVIQLNKNVWDFWVVIFNQFIIELHIIMQGIHIPCDQSYSTYSYSEAAHYEHSYSKHKHLKQTVSKKNWPDFEHSYLPDVVLIIITNRCNLLNKTKKYFKETSLIFFAFFKFVKSSWNLIFKYVHFRKWLHFCSSVPN